MKLILILLCCISTFANARSELRELMYFPEKGKFWAESFVILRQTKFDFANKYYEVDTKSFSQAVNYTVLKDLKVGVGLSAKVITTNPENSDISVDQGLDNPIFNIEYRLQWQSLESNNFDLGFNFRPDLITAKDSDTENEGSVTNGRNEFEVYLSTGKRVDELAWEFKAFFHYNFEGEKEDADGEGKTEISSTSSIGSSFNLQHFIDEKLSYILSTGLNFPGESKDKQSNGTVVKTKRYTVFSLGAEGLYSMTKDLYLSAGYVVSFPGGQKIETDYSGTEYEFENYITHSMVFKGAYNF